METNKVTADQDMTKNEQESTVKGTMFSVGIVGLVIFLFYIVLFGFYMARV